MQNTIENPANFDYGKSVDEFIVMRVQAMKDLKKSVEGLKGLGAHLNIRGVENTIEGMDVAAFKRCNESEFAWEAVYKDGSQIRQYDDYAMDRHFGDIDQEKLELIRWVSNFDTDTSNTCKRIIVTLDMRTGLFSFFNGLVHPTVKEVYLNPMTSMDGAKLILKKRVRTSFTGSTEHNKDDETISYNRYLLGFEIGELKRLICIEPNGFIHLQD